MNATAHKSPFEVPSKILYFSLALTPERTLLYYTLVPMNAVYYAMTERRAHAATYYDKYPARAIWPDRRDRLPKTVKYFRDSHNLSPWLPTPLDERVPPRPRLSARQTKRQLSWIVIGNSSFLYLGRSIS